MQYNAKVRSSTRRLAVIEFFLAKAATATRLIFRHCSCAQLASVRSDRAVQRSAQQHGKDEFNETQEPLEGCAHPGRGTGACGCLPSPALHSPCRFALLQLSEQAFVQGGLDRADWRKRKYVPPSVDEAVDANEASQFDEGRVSTAPANVAATCVLCRPRFPPQRCQMVCQQATFFVHRHHFVVCR